MSRHAELPIDPGFSPSWEQVRVLLPSRCTDWPAWMQNNRLSFGDCVTGAYDKCRAEWQACAKCGACNGDWWNDQRKVIEVHHLLYGAGRRRHFVTNLCPLCRECHEWAHDSTANRKKLFEIREQFDPGRWSPLWLTLINHAWIFDEAGQWIVL